MHSRPQRAEPSLDATPPNTRPVRYAGALAEKAELSPEGEAPPFEPRRTRGSGGLATVARPARERRGVRRHATDPAGHHVHLPHLRVVTEAPPEPPVWRLAIKRGLDILGAIVGLALSAPLLLLLAPLVRLDSPGRAVFAQERVGRRGRAFACYKLRTMRADAEHLLEADAELRAEYEANGFKVPVHADPRITPLGRFLRVTSLDELPQFWNVLRGDMSLVGPRPIVPAELEHYANHEDTLLSVRPGLTGSWAVRGRSCIGYPERAAIELAYVRDWTLATDLGILARTVVAVLQRRGAY